MAVCSYETEFKQDWILGPDNVGLLYVLKQIMLLHYLTRK
jgi:hypothetical protein